MPKSEADIKVEPQNLQESASVEDQPEITDILTEEEPQSRIPNPELGVVEARAPEESPWAIYFSAFFSPLLMPTYCVTLAMWITPISSIAENTRIIASLTILVLTALAPFLYLAMMVKLRVRKSFDHASRWQRIAPGITFALCQLVGAYYLYMVYAPEWLFMVLVAGAVTTLVYIGLNFFILVSGHMCAMGTLFAFTFFLGKNDLSTVVITPWLIGILLIAGAVGSARLRMERHNALEVGSGFFAGMIVTYIMLNVHLFDSKIPML